MSANTLSKITGIPKERYLDVGAGSNYSTIEGAVEKLINIAPDPGDEFYIRLADAAYQLVDGEVYLPENSGIISGRTDVKPVITGTSGRTQSQGCFNVSSNNLYYGFKVVSDPTGSGSAFRSEAGTTGDIRFQNVETSDDGDDSFYLFGGGDYYFDGCDINVGWDGIAVFGSDAVQNINISNTHIRGLSTASNILIRVDNDNAVVNVDKSFLTLRNATARNIGTFGACVGSGLSGLGAVAYDLNVSNSIIKSHNSVPPQAIASATSAIIKNTGRMDIDNTDIITVNELTAAENANQDAALWLEGVADLSTGITDTRIHNDASTLALSQIDKGSNTVTGFKIT